MNALPVRVSPFTSLLGLWRSTVLGFLLCFLQHSAFADIWGYVDDKGTEHFAEHQVDERYTIFFRGGTSFDTADAPTAEGDLSGLTVPPVISPVSASRAMAFFDKSPSYKVIRQHLRDASLSQQIDYELLQALIATESGFNTFAVSPKGAVGLMQLMPATAARYGVADDKKNSIEKKLADPQINIKAGARYLGYLIHHFPDQLELALAAYNAGEGAVQRAGNKIPNYKETQNYVKTVMQLYTLLKPPVVRASPYQVPKRVRMQLQGGAVSRSNMISSGYLMTPRTNLSTETE